MVSINRDTAGTKEFTSQLKEFNTNLCNSIILARDVKNAWHES